MRWLAAYREISGWSGTAAAWMDVAGHMDVISGTTARIRWRCILLAACQSLSGAGLRWLDL